MSKSRIFELLLVVAAIAVGYQFLAREQSSGQGPPPPPVAKSTPSNEPPVPPKLAPADADAWKWHMDKGEEIYQAGYAVESAGDRASAYGLYRQAQAHYQIALDACEEPTGRRRKRSLEKMRWICISQQKWAEEEPHTRALLAFWERDHDPADPVMLSQAHYEMARCLHRVKKYEESDAHFEEAIALRGLSKSGHNWVYYDNYSRLLVDWGKPEEARRMAAQALEIKAAEEANR